MWHRSARPFLLLPALAVVGAAAFFSCTSDSDSKGGSASCEPSAALQPQATEWVGFHTEVPLVPADFHALASGLVGADAQAGKLLHDKQIASGIYISAAADPSTPDQAQLTLAFDDGAHPRRKLAVAPASFAVGNIFVATVDAALAKMKTDNAAKAGSGEQFYLEYRVASSQGGKLSLGVRGNQGVYSLVVDIASPHTSLEDKQIGKAADAFEPYDSVAGTVWFHMSKDDFDFFTDHAYGQGATSKQNFKDFTLVPHDWLRLTVDPHLDQQFVNVSFEVVTVDNKRLAVAKAPASVLAGDTFQKLVDRNMQNMLDQESAKAGSSTPWQVPFYYDHPAGGGVVQVIAQGSLGSFSVAYAIESPRHPLKDVPFVSYLPVKIAPPDPSQTSPCQKLGDPKIVLAPKGTLDITFTVSDTILKSPDLMGPLKGPIYCSVFRAEDVTVAGPKAGAKELQGFSVPNADLQGKPPPMFTTDALFAGEYQVLCAQDLDGDGMASHGDPVTLPIGSYTVACNKNPTTVQFSILDPL